MTGTLHLLCKEMASSVEVGVIQNPIPPEAKMNASHYVEITSNGKVRDRIPETPIEKTPSLKRRTKSNPKVVYPEIAGVKARAYAALPTELWNDVTSLFGEMLRTVAGRLDEAFVRNEDEDIPELLQSFIPEVVSALGRGLMESLLRQRRGFYGSRITCHCCGEQLSFQGYVKKIVKTKVGPIEMKRAYYHGECGHSAAPLDYLLGLDGKHSVLPDLQECAALLATSLSYPQAVKTLERLLPVGKFSLKLGEQVTSAVATDFVEIQRDEASTVEPGWQAGEPLEDRTVIASVDGGMCRVRDHDERFREFKLAVIGDLGPEATVENKSYVATFKGPNEVYSRAVTDYVRKRCDRARRLHMMIDGATWIARRADELAHPGQELTIVLDWYHATEKLKECANHLFGLETAENRDWYETAKGALYDENLREFFRMLRTAADFDRGGEQARKTLSYFKKRSSMLRYKTFREMGLPIGSGIVEGGIRFVGKDRLDGTGMRWSTPGAELVLQLRCLEASGRWDEYCRTRSTQRQARFRDTKACWLSLAA